MKQLILTSLLCMSIMLANAQQSDTLEIQRNKNGNVTYARFKNSDSRELKDGIAFLKQILKGTENDNFKLIKDDTDKLGIVHLRYQQYYKGIKVDRAEFSLHGKGGNIETINGHYANVSLPSIEPAFDENQALKKALSFVNAKKYKWEDADMERFAKQNSKNPNATYYPKGELVIVKDSLNNFELAWKFIISTLEPDDELLVIINAVTGKLINKRTLILDNNVACVAETRYSNNQNITGDTYAGGIRLSEVRNNVTIHTLNMRNQLNNYTNAGEFSNNNTNWTSGSWTNITQDQAALDAHWGAEMVFDFWLNVFNRNSIDGNGIPIIGYVHYYEANSPFGWPNNAHWMPGNNNHFMQYGDGDGITFEPFVALDITAHEIGHGINEFTSDLSATTNGSQEEDALNEGLSDIWGISVKNFAAPNKALWLLGGEILLNHAYNCIRDAQDPKSTLAEEGRHPDTYHGQYWSNNGEPHTNSTVLSHWFYLLVVGGSGTNDNSDAYNVSSIGINEAEQIVYQAEAHHLQPGDGYTDARNAMITAATELYCDNSPEVASVTNAWYAVGVGAAYSGNIVSVSGSDYLCTTGSYTVANQPSGVNSIVWSSSNTSIATINSTSGNATKVDNGNTDISAIVTSTSGCSTTTLPKLVTVGTGIPMNGTYNSPDNPAQQMEPIPPRTLPLTYNAACVAFATNLTLPVGSSALWSATVDPGVVWGQIGNNIWCNFSAIGQEAVFSVSVSNGCGSYNKNFAFKCTTMSTCGIQPQFVTNSAESPQQFTIMLSPNPVNNLLQVSLKAAAGKTQQRGITELQVIDNMGNVRLTKKTGSGTGSSMSLQVSSLPKGVYLIRVSDGSNWATATFMKE